MTLGTWRDIAIVLLALQLFIMLLIPLVIAFFSMRGINWVHGKVPPLWEKAHHYSHLMRDKTGEISDRVVAPVLRTRSRVESWATVVDRVRGVDRSSPTNEENRL